MWSISKWLDLHKVFESKGMWLDGLDILKVFKNDMKPRRTQGVCSGQLSPTGRRPVKDIPMRVQPEIQRMLHLCPNRAHYAQVPAFLERLRLPESWMWCFPTIGREWSYLNALKTASGYMSGMERWNSNPWFEVAGFVPVVGERDGLEGSTSQSNREQCRPCEIWAYFS
jgi:hypothetical protein